MWNGSLDEVRLWRIARSASDIADNHRRVIDPASGLDDEPSLGLGHAAVGPRHLDEGQEQQQTHLIGA